jgi:hypothetical protein
MNTKLPAQAQSRSVAISGRDIPVSRIVNRNDLKLSLQRPTPHGFVPIIDGCIPDIRSVKEGGHTYGVGGGKVGLSAPFFKMVQSAAGIQIIDVISELCDVNGEPGARSKVTGVLPRAGELPLQSTAECTMSFSNAYAAYGIKDAKGRAKESTFLPRKLETMAKSRVIRDLTGLKSSYTIDDLEFDAGNGSIVPVVFAFRRDQLDMQNAEVRKAYIDSAAQTQARLYGSGSSIEEAEARACISQARAPIKVADSREEVTRDPEFSGGVDEDADFDDLGSADQSNIDSIDAALLGSYLEGEEDDPMEQLDNVDAQFRPGVVAAKIPADFQDKLAQCANDKKQIYAVMKTLDEKRATAWTSFWIIETNYDMVADEMLIYKVWQDGKAFAPHRALVGLEFNFRKVQRWTP